MLKFQILTDNIVNKAGILGEHGLSIWIEKDGKHILFDSGQTDVFMRNAKAMGIDALDADAAVLSHGHYDHCGGLSSCRLKNPDTKIFVNRKALRKKYEIKNGKLVDIGIPDGMGSLHQKGRLAFTGNETEIFPGVTVISGIGKYNDFETVPERFKTEDNGKIVHDEMEDEQLLVIEDGGKLAVFSGCSHRGIINCVEEVRHRFPEKRIGALIAGMHLRGANEEHISYVANYLNQSGINVIVPLHCTGTLPICRIKDALAEKCLVFSVGDSLTVD